MYVYALCVRCGYQWEIAAKRNNLNAKCDSCKATRKEKITYGDEVCFPWSGDFDQDDRPMLKGELYLPGYRLCKHRDCTNVNHIVPFN